MMLHAATFGKRILRKTAAFNEVGTLFHIPTILSVVLIHEEFLSWYECTVPNDIRDLYHGLLV